MRTSFFILLLAICFSAGAQEKAVLPPFRMQLTDGRVISTSELAKSKPVLLIYFAPDCDHCVQLMNALFGKAGELARAEVLLVTFKPVRDLFPFEKKYGTARYPNIRVGSETAPLFLQKFYNLDHTPFTALFDSQKKLSHSYRKDTPVEDLIRRLKQLN